MDRSGRRTLLSFDIRPWGLLTAAGAVACAGTVLGFMGSLSWVLDLFSHFRVQYLLGLVVLGTILVVARRRTAGLWLLAFACLNFPAVLPLYLGGRGEPPDRVPALRAMLLNVNSRLGDPDKVQLAVREADPDILVLEEITTAWVNQLAWLTNSHPHTVIQTREDNFGIGLFSRLPLTDAAVVYIGEAGVPSIVATLTTGTTKLHIIATHPLPPGGRDYSAMRNEQLAALAVFTAPRHPVILLGDLNTTPWNRYFRRLLHESGLHDSSRGWGVQTTWPNFSPLLRVPLDHLLHSPQIIVVDRRIGPDVGSDHFPLIVDLGIAANNESLE